MRNKNKKSSTKQATTQLSRHVCDVLLVAMFGLRGKMWFLSFIFRKKKMNVAKKKLYHTQLYLPLNNIKSIWWSVYSIHVDIEHKYQLKTIKLYFFIIEEQRPLWACDGCSLSHHTANLAFTNKYKKCGDFFKAGNGINQKCWFNITTRIFFLKNKSWVKEHNIEIPLFKAHWLC